MERIAPSPRSPDPPLTTTTTTTITTTTTTAIAWVFTGMGVTIRISRVEKKGSRHGGLKKQVRGLKRKGSREAGVKKKRDRLKKKVWGLKKKGPQFGACQLAIEIYFWKAWEWALLGQILARSLLEPDLANLGLASWLLKFASGKLGNGPFWAKSWPGACWSQIWPIWGLPAGY